MIIELHSITSLFHFFFVYPSERLADGEEEIARVCFRRQFGLF